jgi:hypothetical protein
VVRHRISLDDSTAHEVRYLPLRPLILLKMIRQ